MFFFDALSNAAYRVSQRHGPGHELEGRGVQTPPARPVRIRAEARRELKVQAVAVCKLRITDGCVARDYHKPRAHLI